jgi:hypothetical protein
MGTVLPRELLPGYASEEARHHVAAWIELMPDPPKLRSRD